MTMTEVRRSVFFRLRGDRGTRLLTTSALLRGRLEAGALGGPIVVGLDWVELRGGMRALVAGLCTGKGGALPISTRA